MDSFFWGGWWCATVPGTAEGYLPQGAANMPVGRIWCPLDAVYSLLCFLNVYGTLLHIRSCLHLSIHLEDLRTFSRWTRGLQVLCLGWLVFLGAPGDRSTKEGLQECRRRIQGPHLNLWTDGERERERETFWDLHFSWVILVCLFFYSGVFLILNVFPSSGGKGISANDMGNLWC